MIEFIGVLATFALIFILALKRVNLGLVLLLASTILGVTSYVSPQGFLKVAYLTFTDYTTYELILSVGFISILGNCLKETGFMVDMIESLRGFLSSKWLVALIPALFGLLPMPGGALMSAPFNEGEADRLKMSAEEKTYVNVWFRHFWFFASPISSTTILISRLVGVNLYTFLLTTFPISFLLALVGYFFSIRRFKNASESHHSPSLSALVKGLLPILLTIILNILGVLLPVAILVGISLILVLGRMGLRKSASAVWHGVHWDILSALIGVIFFRYMINESGSVTLIFSRLKDAGVPVLVLVTIFPFLIGFTSGTPQSGIGIGVPLVLPLFSSLSLHVVAILYLSIVVGYMMSPLHLCFVLTNAYYKSDLAKVYRTLVPSLLVLYAAGLFYLLLRL